MENTRNMPDVETLKPVRIAELKLVEGTTSVKAPEFKAAEPPSFADDVEDMWDNLPV